MCPHTKCVVIFLRNILRNYGPAPIRQHRFAIHMGVSQIQVQRNVNAKPKQKRQKLIGWDERLARLQRSPKGTQAVGMRCT